MVSHREFQPPPVYVPPPKQDCCCLCANPCRYARARMHGARIFSENTAENDPTCTDPKLKVIIQEVSIFCLVKFAFVCSQSLLCFFLVFLLFLFFYSYRLLVRPLKRLYKTSLRRFLRMNYPYKRNFIERKKFFAKLNLQ